MDKHEDVVENTQSLPLLEFIGKPLRDYFESVISIFSEEEKK